ncbi:oligosaccharide flippase family protein [Arthrobacter sp. MDT2-16]
MLGPSEFGLYFTALTVAAIVGIVLDSCVAQAILTKTPGHLDHWRSWRRNSLYISAGGAATAAVVATTLIDSPDLLFACWLLACSIPLTVASMVPRAFLLGSGELRVVAATDAFAAVAANTGAVLLVSGTHSIAAAASSSVLLAALRLVLLQYAFAPALPTKGDERTSKVDGAWSRYWKQISGTYQSQLFNFLSRTADNLLISVILGPTSLAQYSRAFSFAIGPVQQAQMALTPTAIRDFAESKIDEGARVRNISSRTISALLPGTVMISVIGPTLVPTLLGPGWEPAGELMLLSVGLAVSSILSMPARWLLVARRDNRRLRIDSYLQLALLASVGLGAAVGGLSAAMIASSCFVAPISTVILWWNTGPDIFRMFVRKLIPVCAYVLVAVAANAALVLWIGPGGFWSVIWALVMAGMISCVSIVLVEKSIRLRT